MSIYWLFLLTTVVFTAVPHGLASDEVKLQRVILEEIIQSIRDMKGNLAAEVSLLVL